VLTAPVIGFLQTVHAGATAAADSTLQAPSGHLMKMMFRFLFTTVPQWVQIGGIAIGGPIALIVIWQLWIRRGRIWNWFTAKSRGFKIATFGIIGLCGLGAVGVGAVGYSYMMHDNDFCQSCHIMDTAWNRFQVSAHKKLTCHECHRQPMYVSTIELYWWVLERRMAVPAHDKVPSKICAECHLKEKPDSLRDNVLLTAGHKLHLKSDSSALKNVQCTTCHGHDFHMFKPNNATCSQAGCHTNMRVKLGRMATEAPKAFLHCTVCHGFNTEAASGTSTSEAKKIISPVAKGCSTCHAMSQKIATFDLEKDPHKGGCGSCHNPHKQTKPAEAFNTCATAQCHANADTLTAFHRGIGVHRLDECGACHQPHSWKVKGTDCLACHKTIYQDLPSKRPGATARRSAAASSSHHRIVGEIAWQSFDGRAPVRGGRQSRFSRRARIVRPASLGGIRTGAAPSDSSTFAHSKHRKLACTECHGTTGSHGAIKITAPEGCLGCHHGAAQKSACANCHTTTAASLKEVPVTFHVTARKGVAPTRNLPFRHAQHGRLDCARCHASDAKKTMTATCTGCHADHHAPDRECSTCHANARDGHDRASHDGCTNCHTDARFAAMVSSRTLCLSCHARRRDHYPAADCANCHAVSTHGPGMEARTP
jgi:nitrate/TMAO reductase-like tetraheme cytochrome c subunit